MKIITIFDKNEDFIELQYNSIIKHVKGKYEYIVFNNGKTKEQANKIKNICNTLGITCIRIKVFYFLSNPSKIAGDALNESYKHIVNQCESFFKLDSDMFFINDVNLEQILEENDLVYVPTHVPRKTMWSGVFGINIKKVKFDFDFRPGVIPKTDTFGQSCLLLNDNRYSEKLLELYNLQDIKDDIIETNLNTDCVMKFNKDGLTFTENNNYKINYNFSYLKDKYDQIINTMEKYNFPKPYSIDFISINGEDFLVHFKSSNWCPWYTEKYVTDKKDSIKRLLNSINSKIY